MDKQTRTAIDNAANYLCSVLNESIGVVLPEPLTPEKLTYLLLLSDDVPDGKEDETLGTIRGIKQRMYYLQRAVQGEPGAKWLRYWSKGRGQVKLLEEEERIEQAV